MKTLVLQAESHRVAPRAHKYRFTSARFPVCFHSRTTMTHDGALHRVFKIGELARLITSQLVAIRGKKSAVNLACACRYIEEPVLSALWETQQSLRTLLELLPGENRDYDDVMTTRNTNKVRDLDLSLGGPNT